MMKYFAASTLAALCFADAFTARFLREESTASFLRPRWTNDNRSTLRMTSIDPSISSNPSLFADATDGNTDYNNDSNNVELWLDLRDTAILPIAALELMSENKWQSDDLVIDKVLISENDLARVVKQYNGNSDASEVDILYASENDNTIRNLEDTAEIVGHIITLQDDPIPALDTLSSGGWIVIDSNDIKDEDKRDQAVMGLVEFLSAGASSSATAESLLLGSGGNASQGDASRNKAGAGTGGIVLSCSSKTDVLRAGASTQSIVTSDSLTTTEGGILIQAKETASCRRRKQCLQAAVAIPFDATLWKAVSVVFGSFDDDSM
mmetsp:Transcript_34977/g.76510  ORF Transcript_34977/g.76510 Transcript_34977/m.76510 type:complete len:322 (+) Transcript_34977:62-1027(+)